MICKRHSIISILENIRAKRYTKITRRSFSNSLNNNDNNINKIKTFRSSTMTQILPVDPTLITFGKDDKLPSITDEITLKNLTIASEEIKKSGGIVGFPTETVYGLGGSAINDESVKAIYKAKNRPADNPLIIHISSIDQLKRKLLSPNQEIPLVYQELIENFWPGPLTILFPIENLKETNISKYVTTGLSTFGVRMPKHPVARALIALSDTPLAAPSANASTRPSPTMAKHVYNDLNGRIPYILDGGSCQVGVESTVVDGLVDPPMLLRPGGISMEEIIEKSPKFWSHIIKAKKTADENEVVKTPGMKYRHYSPSAKVILFNNCGNGQSAINKYVNDKEEDFKKIALLKLKRFDIDDQDDRFEIVKNLGKTGIEISQNLFSFLREVDELNVDIILVEGIEETNEGLAVMNRLSKAAIEVIEGDDE